MEEENVGKALEDSMNRLKRNSDIWDAICDTKEEEDVLVRQYGRNNNPFKERRFYEREQFKDSFSTSSWKKIWLTSIVKMGDFSDYGLLFPTKYLRRSYTLLSCGSLKESVTSVDMN